MTPLDLRERAEAFFKPENMNRDGKTLIEQLTELLAAIHDEGWDNAATWLWENGGPYEHHAARLLAANKPT